MLVNNIANNEEEELSYLTSLEEKMMKMDDKKETTPTATRCVRDEMTNTNEEEKTTPWATSRSKIGSNDVNKITSKFVYV